MNSEISSEYKDLVATAVEVKEDYFEGISARRAFIKKNNPHTVIERQVQREDLIKWSYER